MVGNALLTMYSKCWIMDDAIKIFNNMPTHNTVSWNGLLAGHLFHRQGDEALALWSKMKKMAQCHKRFSMMKKSYGNHQLNWS